MVAAIELRQLPMNRTLLRPTRRIAARARAQPGRHSSALPLPMGVRRVEAWAPRSAVCLTGLQRSFPEIGGSIKEAVDYLLPPRAREIFGVRPADDPWDAVQRLLPMQSLVTQAPCHHNLSLSLRSYYFCHQHGLTADIEMIAMDEVNTAYDRMQKSDVKYRFVIDMATLKG